MTADQIRTRTLDAEEALTDVVEHLLKEVNGQELRGKTLLQIERLRTARFLVTSTMGES